MVNSSEILFPITISLLGKLKAIPCPIYVFIFLVRVSTLTPILSAYLCKILTSIICSIFTFVPIDIYLSGNSNGLFMKISTALV